MTKHEQMMISALRYALPRRSYIMSDTEEYIINMLKEKCSESFIHVLIQDIEEEMKERNGNENFLQHDWNLLLTKLRVYKKQLTN